MSSIAIGIICLVVMLIMILLGFNIGLSFMLTGFVGYAWIVGFEPAVGLLRSSLFKTASNYTFVTLPLFILMGQLAFYSSMSTGLYDFGSKWLNRLPGGLACATVVACAGFGAICGSVNATAATMGVIALPEMRKHGYKDSLTAGSIAAGGTLGIMIPPSGAFILYGMCAETSIGQLFAAGIVPGMVLTIIMCITIVMHVKMRPEMADSGEKYTWKERLVSIKGIIPVAVLFIAVFGGMFIGVFTVNESAAVGVLLAAIYMVFNRTMTWKTLVTAMKDTIRSCAMICLITMGANVLNSFIATSRISAAIANGVVGLGLDGVAVMVVIAIIWIIMGCFMDTLAIILLTVPIFLPIAEMYGISLIWLGVLCVLTGMIGCITPPVGTSLFVLAGLDKKISFPIVVKGVIPFLISMLIMLVIIFIWPDLCTWLPAKLFAA